MNSWELEALASAIAKKVNFGQREYASHANPRAVASAVVAAMAKHERGSVASSRVRSTSAATSSFASSISRKTASGIAARLASGVSKKLDDGLSSYVASAVMHRLNEKTLDVIASQVAKKVASQANMQTRRAGLKPVSYTHLTLPTIYSV